MGLQGNVNINTTNTPTALPAPTGIPEIPAQVNPTESQPKTNDKKSKSTKEETVLKETPKVEEKPVSKKYTVVINGREEIVDESTLLRGYQRQKAANELFEKASVLRKEAEAKEKLAKENPIEFFKKLGLNDDQITKLAEDHIASKLKHDMLSDDERKLKEKESELEVYRQREKEREDTEKNTTFEAQKQKLRDEYDKQISSAITKAELPPHPMIVARVAYYMREALKNGLQDITPEDGIDMVKRELTDQFIYLFRDYDDIAKLEKIIPKEFFNRLRQYDLSKLKNPLQTKTAAGTPAIEPLPIKKKLTKEEFKQRIRERIADE